MFGLFKKGGKKKKAVRVLADLDGNALNVSDHVLSLRYELGECLILETESGLVYESLKSGKQVSWAKMIDASTDRQKVKKIIKDTENINIQSS